MPASRWSRHKRILKLAKGFRGRAKNCYRIAKPRVLKSLQHAYRGRKEKKRRVRSLWIQRINAGVRQIEPNDASYSWFQGGLAVANIELNRKVLADLAISEPFSFRSIFDTVSSVAPIRGAKGELGESGLEPGEREREKREKRHFDAEKERRDRFFEELKKEGVDVIRF